MKSFYFLFLFAIFVSLSAVSQTGIIKVQKAKPSEALPPSNSPSAKKTTPNKIRFILSLEGNYTLKHTDKYGYQVALGVGNKHLMIGIKYSFENEYYRVSPFNKETLRPDIGYLKSENKSNYLKLPLIIGEPVAINQRTNIKVSLGLVPEYLLNTSNQYNRLNYSDFNQFNMSGLASIEFMLHDRFSISFAYSKDFFENLRDQSVYNESGIIIDKQKSKTNLFSIGLNISLHGK